MPSIYSLTVLPMPHYHPAVYKLQKEDEYDQAYGLAGGFGCGCFN